MTPAELAAFRAARDRRIAEIIERLGEALGPHRERRPDGARKLSRPLTPGEMEMLDEIVDLRNKGTP